jgi:DNA helicase-2/ATP-dependent DNA helicase PcrA
MGTQYFQTIKAVADAWNQLNNEVLNIEDIILLDSTLGIVLENLRNLLVRDQFIDYSLMIRLVIEALEEDSTNTQNAIDHLRHIMVDEYQDTYPLQDHLFRLLHDRTNTLFVVGDDDQAIYGWNGADVSNIMDFPTRYTQCSHHELSTNFRSTNIIVNSSSQFISRQLGPQRMSKNPQSFPNNDSKPNQVGKFLFLTREDEANWVAERIEYLIGKSYEEKDGTIRGLTHGDFAILMKSTLSNEQNGNPRHLAFTNALRERGIEPFIESEGSIFNYPSVNLLGDTFELLRNNDLNREELQRFFNNRISPVFTNSSFTNISRVLSEWQRNIHEPGRRKVKPQQLLHDLLEAFGFANATLGDMETHAIGQFSKIMNDVESVYFSIDTAYRFASILNFLNYLANPITSDDYEASASNLLQRPNAVFISTIHKAKGLEFPVVFVVDVQAGRFPGPNRGYRGWLPDSLLQNAIARGAYQNNREGEIRVFYTAITRAERYLYVTGCQRLPNGTRTNRESVFTQQLVQDEIVQDSNILPENLHELQEQPRIDENVMPTSFSDIRYYLTCPKNYQFRKIFGFNPIVPDLYGYGLTIHTSIGKLHQNFRDSSPTVDDAETITQDTFHLKHVPQRTNPDSQPGPYERALDKAIEITRNYVNNFNEDFVRERQVEQRFEIPANQTVISGSIDLLVKEDSHGNVIDVKVIDFKSINEPDEEERLDWIDLSLQVQLYAKAANEVLGRNARTGAVHLLRDNQRVEIPITEEAINAAISNIEWAVTKIISEEFPMRPENSKCDQCDFRALCRKAPEQFNDDILPPPIHLPDNVSHGPIMIKAFSQITE